MKADLNLEHDERYLRAKFDTVPSFTVGAEEEILLVDPATGMPLPAADLALDRLRDDPRLTTEFRAAQVEIVTPVCVAVADVARELGAVRRSLAAGLDPDALAVAVGAHPCAAHPGPIASRPRYAAIASAHPWAARHMLTCGLHVHVAVGGADRALAVYNALRSYLPEIIALGANAPFHDGADTGLATARPFLNRSLSRFGVPPAFSTWHELGEFVAWGRRSSTVPEMSHLWWDLRLRPETATIEVRAADAQTRVEDSAAIIALIQCLVYDLAGRFDAGEPLLVHDRDRISEALFVATRDGLAGFLPDLDHGDLVRASERVVALSDRLQPAAWVLGCTEELERVKHLVLAGGGATRQRAIEADAGIDGLVDVLAHETCQPVARHAQISRAALLRA